MRPALCCGKLFQADPVLEKFSNPMNSQPSVSVIIPVYNRIQYVGMALDSVLAQTYKNYEIIVVDDGSNVDVRKCLQNYIDKIRFFPQTHAGPSAARNTGAKNALGKYLAFLDDDDLFEPDKLLNQVALLEANPAAGFCYSSYYLFLGDETKRLVIPKEQLMPADQFAEAYFQFIDITMPSILLRREAFLNTGLFDGKIIYNEDADLWLRMAARYPVVYSLYPSASVRQHSERLSYKNPLMVKGLIEVLQSSLARQPELKERLGSKANEKVTYLRYVLGWDYLFQNEKNKAADNFVAYRDSDFRVHSKLWINILLFLVKNVKPSIITGGHTKLVCARNKLNGS